MALLQSLDAYIPPPFQWSHTWRGWLTKPSVPRFAKVSFACISIPHEKQSFVGRTDFVEVDYSF